MHVPLIGVPLMEVPLIGVHSTGVPLIDVLLISWAINLHRCYHWHRCKKGKKNPALELGFPPVNPLRPVHTL